MTDLQCAKTRRDVIETFQSAAARILAHFFCSFRKSFLLIILWAVSHNCIAQERITLLFAGDMMQHTAQIDAARTSSGYDYSDCFTHLKTQISQADIAIGNLEVTLGGKPYTGYPTFSAPDEYLAAIKDAGFDVLLTANNHCLDRGKKGLERTINMLDSFKIPHLGTYINRAERNKYHPLILKKKGFRIALLNYTYGTNGITAVPPAVVNYINKEEMALDIQNAKRNRPDVIIACMHWGSEYALLPNKEQMELANWLLDQGVTHVIGSHPHVLQPMELRRDANSLNKHVVVYSLGNFFSNMSVRHTDGGALFTLELSKMNQIVKVDNCGYSLVWTSRPLLNGKKNFVLYPVDYPVQKLTSLESNRLNIFVNDSRKLFQTHNVGIEELKSN